jgi:NAD(P)H dehydrogenase (quinone)
MILVTGSAGKTGQAVIRSLARKGQQVRALVRNQEQAKLVAQLGVKEVVCGDLEDSKLVLKAAQGVRAIYHICPNMHPDEVSIGENAINAAKSAGVEQFVYHSVLHPQIEVMPHHWQKLRVEEKLIQSRLRYTILQPAVYMQNVLAGWDRIVAEGIYAVPYRLSTRLSMVDLGDLAEVAGKVLTEPGHDGAIYELCGPEAPTQSEVACLLGKRLDKKVEGRVIELEEWEQGARLISMSDYAVETLIGMFKYYDNYGLRGNSNVLRWLLGREPTSLTLFLTRISTL